MKDSLERLKILTLPAVTISGVLFMVGVNWISDEYEQLNSETTYAQTLVEDVLTESQASTEIDIDVSDKTERSITEAIIKDIGNVTSYCSDVFVSVPESSVLPGTITADELGIDNLSEFSMPRLETGAEIDVQVCAENDTIKITQDDVIHVGMTTTPRIPVNKNPSLFATFLEQPNLNICIDAREQIRLKIEAALTSVNSMLPEFRENPYQIEMKLSELGPHPCDD